MTEADDRVRAEGTERSIAGKVAVGLPVATLVGAVGVGLGFGTGPAILTLAAGALMAVIGLFWASLRTLGGEAPLAEGLAEAMAMRGGETSLLADQKRRVLRALKDLELEHSVGKIDEEDYAEISAHYREQAKRLLREMDVEIGPFRSKAEAIARRHLEKRGLARAPEGATTAEPAPAQPKGERAARNPRVTCEACGASNDADAQFCKKCRARVSRLPCASCQTSNEPDAEFCKKCGAGLGAPPVGTTGTPVEAKDE